MLKLEYSSIDTQDIPVEIIQSEKNIRKSVNTPEFEK